MIQRIQTVYLFLTSLMSLLFLKGSFLNFAIKSESSIIVTLQGIFKVSNGQGSELVQSLIPLSVIIILIPILCIVAIALFKNRKIQILLVSILIILIAGLIIISIFCFYYISNTYSCEFIPGYKMTIPVLMLIFSILAYMGIKKDDNLIKSYDRLR